MTTITIHVGPEGKCWQCKGTGSVAGGMAGCGACGLTRRGGRPATNVAFQLVMPELLWKYPRLGYAALHRAYAPNEPVDRIASILVTRYQNTANWYDRWPPSRAEILRRMRT